jgi:hypothetical protein
LRFRSSASAYLARLPNQTSNRKTWTWSAWVKRGTLGSAYYPALFMGGTGTTNQTATGISFNADTISVGGYNNYWRITTAVYRDPAAWYHIVVALDTTQSVANNRMLIYVNGVQVTAFSTNNTITQNDDFGINQAQFHALGYQTTSYGSNYFDGEMAEVNFVDGLQLTPNSFGSFNSYGVWQPITYGGSYGTNGFYLPFNTNNSLTSYAGSFNGSNQYLYLGGQSNFAFGTGDFTVEFYVNAITFANFPIIYDSRPSLVDGAYPTIYINSSGSPAYYTNTGIRITTNAIMNPNTWYHIAVVRSGAVTTLYLNGVSQGTYNDSVNYLNGANRPIINGGYTGANVLSGLTSNLRVVKGTAVYTSNFTPSTTPLTAITNTQLLTLQNATIVDNSTNAFTINNNGSVVTGQTYPFAINMFSDSGPASNNWAPINISGAFGSTLDYMTDVPTLTSATAANYAVWNPIFSPTGQTVTNGNLTYSATAQYPILSTIGMNSGKYYAEFVFTAGQSYMNAGIANANLSLTGYVGQDANGFGLYSANGSLYYNGTAYSYGSAFTANSTIMIAFDVTNGKIWWGVNGTWINSGNPATGTNPGVAASGATINVTLPSNTWFFGSGTSGQNGCSANFGQQPWTYTPPSGFVALNTYNL